MSHHFNQELHTVFQDTLEKIKKIRTPRSMKYTGLFRNHQPAQQFDKCTIQIKNMDSFEAAGELLCKGLNPVVLNMASDYLPGGGVYKGSKAQEEDLFRRSDYKNTLRKSLGYPLNLDDIIYSPKVTIIKGINYTDISRQDQYSVACIACAAIRKPHIRGDQYQHISDRECMRNKIKMILQTAEYHNHDCLVLGAFGCGAFRNPPEGVVDLFKKELEPFLKSFTHITFAILEKDEYLNPIFKSLETLN
jgi:uncharacterized protein (TIGR02452 family)